MSSDLKRRDVTDYLSHLTENYISGGYDPRIYWAKEVTFDYGTGQTIRVDYMRFKPLNNSISGIEKGDFYCYEVKSCFEDLGSGHGLNFIGDYNYIVCTEEFGQQIMDTNPTIARGPIGIFVPYDNSLRCFKKVGL